MSAPLAYFLTWTCYGQRIHGDPRGTVDRFSNVPGTPVLVADADRHRRSRDRMVGRSVALSAMMRSGVELAIETLCRDRAWLLLACNARSTHVHVVLACAAEVTPERAMSHCKARATAALRREGLIVEDSPVWTRHGSTRWINHYQGLAAAISYVNDWQAGPRRAMLDAHRREVRARVDLLKAWRCANHTAGAAPKSAEAG